MFDLNYKFRRPVNVKTHISSLQIELINLGTEIELKYVNLGKCCSPGEKIKFISLFKQYKDVFSWTYDTNIIQHVIPIKSRRKQEQCPKKKKVF